MFKYIFITLISINSIFANSSKEAIINDVKILIQKEEALALAINRYILENLEVPKLKDNHFDTSDTKFLKLLGNNFDAFKNPITNKPLEIDYLENGRFTIKSMVNKNIAYDERYKFAYNFYIDPKYRVNTQAPLQNSIEHIEKGTLIKYHNLQNKIIEKILKGEKVQKGSKCFSKGYFWQITNNDLIYKYCNSNNKSITVYPKYPLFLEDSKQIDDLKAEIGDKVYTKDGLWGEYLYGIDSDGWSEINRRNDKKNSDMCLEERILNYIPDSKDLSIRSTGGCMLANGDIFCWGDNSHKKAGIESYGQIDKTITPDYINIPVMLKSDLENQDNIKLKDIKWYNSPYRVKFEKMAMNSRMVCGVSPIFEAKIDINNEEEICGDINSDNSNNDIKDETDTKKIIRSAGNLYCNGDIDLGEFEISNEPSAKSILRKNIEFDKNKNKFDKNKDAIFLKDIAMVEDAILLLTDLGDLYSIGKNSHGILGIDNPDLTFSSKKEQLNINELKDIKFVAIAAARDRMVFSALDENDNLYIWGETLNGDLLKPTLVSSSIKFSESYLLAQSETFVIRDNKGKFYFIDESNSLKSIVTDSDEKLSSATVHKDNNSWKIAYVNNEGVLVEKDSNGMALNCKEKNGSSCSGINKMIFDDSLAKLNTTTIPVGNKHYAWFKNISYFKSSIFDREFIDFSKGTNDFKGALHDGKRRDPLLYSEKSVVNSFLGVYGFSQTDSLNIVTDGSKVVSKSFQFDNAKNQEIKIKIKMYELGSWDNEVFNIYINDSIYEKKIFNNRDNSKEITVKKAIIAPNDTRMSLKEHEFFINTKLDENGKIDLGFGAILDENWENEGFGIASIEFTYTKEVSSTFLCSITGNKGLDQMYCWGNVGRSLPIINTGLYDINKIPTINRLFVTPSNNLLERMAFDNFDNQGGLFLQYPTYINSFDYPFKFK